MQALPHAGILASVVAAPPADPEPNASAEVTTSGATNHEITLALGEGTNRLAVISAGFQTSGLNFTSAVFDTTDTNQPMTIVDEAIAAGGPNTQAIYYYYVPDAVTAGNKVLRIVSDTSGNADVVAAAYNNIGGSAPSDVQIAESTFTSTPVLTTVDVANDNDLVITALGTDIAAEDAYSPVEATIRHSLAGGSAGSSSHYADNLTPSAGSLGVGWGRDAGAAASHDVAIVTAVFPHL